MTRDEIMQALASAGSLNEQIKLAAELDALDHGVRATASAERSLDWADTTVRATMEPRRTLDRHTASSDWLARAETDPGEGHHHAVIAEASVWYQRLDPDVKADAGEFVEQAKGIARRTAGKYGERAEEANAAFLQYVAFLNRAVLAASGLPQIQQRVDVFNADSPTPLPEDVFDNFAPPIHPINQGVDGAQVNSLAPGAEEAMAESGGSPVGRPSQHDEGQAPVSEPQFLPPSARQGSHKHAGALERAKDVTARKGHNMHWSPTEGGNDAWMGRCAGCGSSIGVTASGITEGSTAHHLPCTNRSHGSLGAPSVAIDHRYNMNEFLRAEASGDLSGWAEAPDATGEQEAGRANAGGDDDYNDYLQEKMARQGGDAAPFARRAERKGGEDPEDEKEDGHPDDGSRKPWEEANGDARHEGSRREAASGLDQVQQTVDSFENSKPTSLPTDVMFPIEQPWPEEDTSQVLDQGGQDTGPTNRPRQASRKTADTWQGGDAPAAVPGGQTPVANSPATTPPRADSGDFSKGVQQGQQDAAAGERPSFADNSSAVSDFVRGYVQGYSASPTPSGGPANVPGSMGGDNGQAQNFREIQQRSEQPLVNMAHKGGLTVSASLVSKDVSADEDFQRGYRYARTWKPGRQVVAVGSTGEEAGIYAGITDNPAVQKAWVAEHRRQAKRHPELETRLREHKLVTSNLRSRNEDLSVKGLYVQAATSLDLDTMSPVTTPDPQGATPTEGPGTIPPLRDAPGTPAAPGGASPYNGAEPLGRPVVPDPAILEPEPGGIPMQPHSPDAVHMVGDSSLLSKSPTTMAFRRRVQSAKLARRKKEN